MTGGRCQVEASRNSGPPRRLPAADVADGDRVRVRSAEEIAATLDEDGRLRGCAFSEDMLASCGQERRVLRRVERAFDEHDRRMLRVHNVVLLEGSECDGCDYACHHFWRTEWLEKIGEPSRMQLAPPTRSEPLPLLAPRLVREARNYVGGLRRGEPPKPEPARAQLPPADLRAGDWVRVRSEEEIRSSLDSDGKLKGCTFTWTQYKLCGQTFRVHGPVENFYDVAKGRMAKTRNTVLLEGVHCSGGDLPEANGCQRHCYYFWRTEWLEKVS